MKRSRSRGVLLLVSILLVMIIAVVGRAAIALNPGLLNLSKSSQESDLAQRAADSGLEYALYRLKSDPTWKGNGNAIIIDEPELLVEERDGNVFGLITAEDGRVSQFRIRFNFQDGEDGPDRLDNPEEKYWIKNPYVSFNNTGTPGHTPLPRGGGANFEVQDPSVGDYEVPGQAVYVLVEGRTGPGLATLSRTEPNANPSGSTTSVVVESCFQASLEQDVAHAAIMGGGDVNLTVSPSSEVFLSIQGGNADEVPRIRSKGSVVARSSNGLAADIRVAKAQGEIGRNPSGTPGFDGNLIANGATLVDESIGDGSDFYNLKWEDVAQASDDPASPDTIRIPAGTYVMWEDETVHYYDMNLEDYQTYMSSAANRSDPGTKLSWGFPEIRDPANFAISNDISIWKSASANGDTTLSIGIKRDTRVFETGSGVTDFTVMPRRGAKYSPTDESHLTPGGGDSWTTSNCLVRMQDAMLSAPGDVNFMSRVIGNSSTVTAEGEYTQISPFSVIQKKWNDPDAVDGLNIYAQGDVNVSTYRDYNNSFGRTKMSGLLYTWGDFECLTGHEDVSTDRWGEAVFTGTLVAYGSDPSTGTPGSAGSGQVNITASEIKLWNNYESVAGVVEPTATELSLGFKRSLYVTY